jgi:hypothetical protein
VCLTQSAFLPAVSVPLAAAYATAKPTTAPRFSIACICTCHNTCQSPSRATLHPSFSEDSSAPRRQLDGGVAPAADGHGGGRAHPGSPCCCAVLVGWSPRRRLPGGASSRASSGQAWSPWSARPGCLPWRRSPVRVHHVVSTQRFRRPGPTVQPSSVRPSGVQCIQCPALPVSGRPVSGRPVSTRRCPPVRCPLPSVRTRPARPTPGGGGTRSRRRAPSPPERVESRWAAASWSGWMDGRAGPDAGEAAEVAVVSGVGGGPGPGGVTAGGRA